jgi:hypothetical protein
VTVAGPQRAAGVKAPQAPCLGRRRWRTGVIPPLEASSLFRQRRLPEQALERKFLWVSVSTWLASASVIPFKKASLMHPPCSTRPNRGRAPRVPLDSSRELMLYRRFGPPSLDVGVPLLFAVVVAWPPLATDAVLGSTSGSCCRVCDAPSRMLCRVGFGDRLGRLSVGYSPPLRIF